jgi:hypothetical protein
MKSLVSLILFAIVAMAVALCTSCTETIYDEVIKLDTIYLSRPLTSIITERDTIHAVDTVKVEVVIHETDTLIQIVTKDSIIIKEVEKLVTVYKTIIERDTITVTDTVFIDVVQIEQRVIYHDTLYVTSMIREVTSIPDELRPHVQYFYEQATARGKVTIGGNMIIQYVKQSDLPGEGWTSNSFNLNSSAYSGQMVIQISEEVPSEQARSCILRELARMQLNRQYVTDVDKIMCPLFDPYRTITQSDLDVLFNPLPI